MRYAALRAGDRFHITVGTVVLEGVKVDDVRARFGNDWGEVSPGALVTLCVAAGSPFEFTRGDDPARLTALFGDDYAKLTGALEEGGVYETALPWDVEAG